MVFSREELPLTYNTDTAVEVSKGGEGGEEE